KPAMLDLFDATAHYAIGALFDGYLKRESIYCYSARLQDAQVLSEGRKKFSIGQVEIRSRITRAQLTFNFAVLYFGDHNLTAGVRPSQANDAFQPFLEQISEDFSRGDLGECSSMIDRYFGRATYSLKSLFGDERQRIITQLVDSSLADL